MIDLITLVDPRPQLVSQPGVTVTVIDITTFATAGVTFDLSLRIWDAHDLWPHPFTLRWLQLLRLIYCAVGVAVYLRAFTYTQQYRLRIPLRLVTLRTRCVGTRTVTGCCSCRLVYLYNPPHLRFPFPRYSYWPVTRVGYVWCVWLPVALLRLVTFTLIYPGYYIRCLHGCLHIDSLRLCRFFWLPVDVGRLVTTFAAGTTFVRQPSRWPRYDCCVTHFVVVGWLIHSQLPYPGCYVVDRFVTGPRVDSHVYTLFPTAR